VGCIGIGTRGGDLLNAVVHAPNVKVVAVSDVYAPHRQKGLERSRNPDAKAYEDYRDLLADPRVDAVVIATPDHWHCPMVLDAVKAGKDIYCEKGFSRTLEEAKRMRDALQESSVVFQLGHQARQAACALQAKEIIAAAFWDPSRWCARDASSPPNRTVPTGAGTVITINGIVPTRSRSAEP
jgi:predicted dehydrogenase